MNSPSCQQPYHLLVPAGMPPSCTQGDAVLARDGEILLVDAAAGKGGTWAGVAALVEVAYLALRAAGATGIIDQHNYELHMALPRYRSELPLRNGSLTDFAHGAEKTRNFPIDRAYRIVHGLVGFVMKWRELTGAKRQYQVVVEHFDQAQHLARRFFLEAARRSYLGANMRIVVSGAEALSTQDNLRRYVEALPVSLPDLPWSPPAETPPIESEEEAARVLRSFTTMEYVELNYTRLIAFYQQRGDGVGLARAAVSALGVCNHFGYYHEANAFLPLIVPYFDKLVRDNQERRWNVTGNLFQSFLGQGKTDEARNIIHTFAVPYLTDHLFCAKMGYILGILEVRYVFPPNLALAEHHLHEAVRHIEAAVGEIDEHEQAFQKVFIANGLAYLRVKQGRLGEAIEICQSGFALLTEKLGNEQHRLHRSVLQYNTAQVYAMMGDLDAALFHYQQATAIDPNYSEYYNEMGNIRQKQGRFEEALALYDVAAELSPPYHELCFNKGVCLARLERWPAALESARYSLELHPGQFDAYLVRGEINEAMANREDAIHDYEAALALDELCVPAHVNKAILLFQGNDLEGSLAAMNRAIELAGDQEEYFENRAIVYDALGRKDRAERDRRDAALCRVGRAAQESAQGTDRHVSPQPEQDFAPAPVATH